MYFAVFLGRHLIFGAKYPGEMIGRVISDTFSNLIDFHSGIRQLRHCIRHPKLLDQHRKAAAGILLDQRAQVRLTVVEEFRQ